MDGKTVQIIKMDGERAVFDETKLRRSLERAGAGDMVINQVVEKVLNLLHDGMTTKQIYKLAFSLLLKNSRSTAAKFKLKKAIMELGPTGYPFERLVGEILGYQGYRTKVGVMVKGHCVNHEVDVVAEKNGLQLMVECKYHSTQGKQCDVKVPLYIQSRFKDVEKGWRRSSGNGEKNYEGWIFTNTRFTKDAIQYGNCVGLKMIGWDYPSKGSLKERIDLSGMHPITSLTSLTKHEKQRLLTTGIILCTELCNQPTLLESIGIIDKRKSTILAEVNELCKIN